MDVRPERTGMTHDAGQGSLATSDDGAAGHEGPPRRRTQGAASTMQAVDDDSRWQAVRSRSAQQATFCYGVLTTGIYCLPGCPSPTPKREHVVFFDDAADAKAAGLRACRRCRPDDAGVPPWFEAACRALLGSDDAVALVARRLGTSRATLHRSCLRLLGVSPTDLRRSGQRRRLLEAIDGGASALDACMAAGFGSASAAYARSHEEFGRPPGALARRGRGERIEFAAGRSSLGPMVAARTEQGLCLLEFLDVAEDLDDAALLAAARARVGERFGAAEVIAADAAAERALAEAIAAVDADDPGAAAARIPLDLVGTAFQQRVWDALRSLGQGERITYGALAERIGKPKATRAVASAVARNTVAVLVPCHRVVPRAGGDGAYRWGAPRKERLLAREASGARSGNDEGPEGPSK